MERYNYYEVVKNDLIKLIKENYNLNDFQSKKDAYKAIYNKALNSDGVTGRLSESYFCSTWDAEEALCHNFDLLEEAYDANDGTYFFQNGAESCDVMIRCYLLNQVLDEVLDEMMEEREG